MQHGDALKGVRVAARVLALHALAVVVAGRVGRLDEHAVDVCGVGQHRIHQRSRALQEARGVGRCIEVCGGGQVEPLVVAVAEAAVGDAERRVRRVAAALRPEAVDDQAVLSKGLERVEPVEQLDGRL